MQFKVENPTASWSQFRNHDAGRAYKRTKVMIFADQGQLCAYCETRIESTPEQSDLQRIEHVHEKSDTSDVQKNWALDWGNVVGVCKGGSGRENKNRDGKNIFPMPINLSCDAFKAHLVESGKLSIGCEEELINPLFLPASPSLFKFDKRTGMLEPNDKSCAEIVMEKNKYDSTEELVQHTIYALNLNCDRLKAQRLQVWKEYNRLVKKAREANNREIFGFLAERWFGKRWPAFFTTRRALLGVHGEKYLASMNYDG